MKKITAVLLFLMLMFSFPHCALAVPVIDCSRVKVSNKVSNPVVIDVQNKNISNYDRGNNYVVAGYFKRDLPEKVKKIIKEVAEKFMLPARVLEAIAIAESGGNQSAVSPKGAIGVMQLMPYTAKYLGVNPYDIKQNILGGAMYFKKQLDRFGSVPLALAAYNAGPVAVEEWGGIPPYEETRNYVARVMDMIGGSYD